MSNQGLCFVIMSFSGNPGLQDFYQEAVKPVVESLNLRCERVDEQEFNGSIRDKIIENIREAKFVIADLTEARPNCYYELGLAHALGKKVIHISNKRDDIHFDVSDFNFIIYKRLNELKEKLSKRIESTLEESKRIVWVIPNSNYDATDEISVLSRDAGVQIEEKCYIQDNWPPSVNIQIMDAVLFSYLESDNSKEEVRKLVDWLSQQDKCRLIVYSLGQINSEEFGILSVYANKKVSNMPSTLHKLMEEL